MDSEQSSIHLSLIIFGSRPISVNNGKYFRMQSWNNGKARSYWSSLMSGVCTQPESHLFCNLCLLEEQLQPQLHGPIAARTEDRVTSCLVWCGATTPEQIGHRRISFIADTKAARSPVRICKVGMVENVEELRPELSGEPFLELELFGYGQIPIAETGVAPNVTGRSAEGSCGGRNQHGIALGVAAETVERSGGWAVRYSVHLLGGRRAGSEERSGLGAREYKWVATWQEGTWNGLSTPAGPRAGAIRNGGVAGFKIARIAEKIPAISILTRITEIVGLIVAIPWLAGLQRYNGIELPSLQKLSRRFLSRNRVSDRNREAMFYIEVTARIFKGRIPAVLGKELADIVGIIVEGVRIRVGGQEREPVRCPLLQCRLQAVVIGFIEI